MDKVQKCSDSVMHHRQNPLESDPLVIYKATLKIIAFHTTNIGNIYCVTEEDTPV
jgi:hypothetical protein